MAGTRHIQTARIKYHSKSSIIFSIGYEAMWVNLQSAAGLFKQTLDLN
jgi:hypothetical protein